MPVCKTINLKTTDNYRNIIMAIVDNSITMYETLQQRVGADPDSAAYRHLSVHKRSVLADVVGTKERMVLEIPINERIDEVLLRDAQALILCTEQLIVAETSTVHAGEYSQVSTEIRNLSNSLKTQLRLSQDTRFKYSMYPAVRRSHISGLDNYVDGAMDNSFDHVLEYSEQRATNHAEMELCRSALESEISALFLHCSRLNWPDNMVQFSSIFVDDAMTSVSDLVQIDRTIDSNRLQADTLLADLTAEYAMLEGQSQTTERLESQRIESERIEAERMEAESIESEVFEAEMFEDQIEPEMEDQRIEDGGRMAAEAEAQMEDEVMAAEAEAQMEAQRLEDERMEAEAQMEAQRFEDEIMEAEMYEAEMESEMQAQMEADSDLRRP